MNKRIVTGILSALTMVLIMGVGLVSYNKNIFVGVSDAFNTRSLAIETSTTINLLGCEELKQTLLVTDDTVVINYPQDSLKQPLLGKPIKLVNNNHTLIVESSSGEVFSLTYWFDQADTTGVTPLLIIKRPLQKQVFYLSKTKECSKLQKYLSN